MSRPCHRRSAFRPQRASWQVRVSVMPMPQVRNAVAIGWEVLRLQTADRNRGGSCLCHRPSGIPAACTSPAPKSRRLHAQPLGGGRLSLSPPADVDGHRRPIRLGAAGRGDTARTRALLAVLCVPVRYSPAETKPKRRVLAKPSDKGVGRRLDSCLRSGEGRARNQAGSKSPHGLLW